jgi:hypothetical protein
MTSKKTGAGPARPTPTTQTADHSTAVYHDATPVNMTHLQLHCGQISILSGDPLNPGAAGDFILLTFYDAGYRAGGGVLVNGMTDGMIRMDVMHELTPITQRWPMVVSFAIGRTPVITLWIATVRDARLLQRFASKLANLLAKEVPA